MAHIFEARPPRATDGATGDFFYDVSELGSLLVVHYGPKGLNGAWPIVGAIGADHIIRGSLSPDPREGADGDLYHNAAAGLVYGPKAAGVWPWPVRVSLPNPIQEDEERRAREYRKRSSIGAAHPMAAYFERIARARLGDVNA